MTSRVSRVAVGVAALVVAFVGFARPAAAHAEMETESPAAESIVTAAPRAVVLEFSEGVDPGLGGIKVIRPDGSRADRGRTERRSGGRRIAVPVDASARGTYTVGWSVVSDDGHQIAGSFVFSVGKHTGGAADLNGDGRAALHAFGGLARGVGFLAALVLVGTLFFAEGLIPGHQEDRLRRRLQGLALLSSGLLMAASGASLLVQIAQASGRPLTDAVGLVGDAVANTRFGALAALRFVAAATALSVALVARGRPGSTLTRAAVIPAAVATAVPSFAGHAWTTSPRALAVAVDLTHQGSLAVWVGGVIALATGLPVALDGVALACRFSRVATVSAPIAVATGTVAAWLNVRSVEALTTTTYGRLLVIKAIVVVILLAVAGVNRGHLLDGRTNPRSLRRLVSAEVGLIVGVIAVTAVFVNQPPARVAVTRPFSTDVILQRQPARGGVRMELAPARAGENDAHLYFFDIAGLPRPVDAVEVKVGRPGIPARLVKVTPITADHVSLYSVALPTAGRWTFHITTVRNGQPSVVNIEVPIR